MTHRLDAVEYFGLGTITKTHKNADGTVSFEASKATGPDLDHDEQILDPTWAKAAMSDWFLSGANLREQHQSIAAGKGLTLESRADGEYVSGIVVDPSSAKKTELGVLAGLSVGIKGPQIIKDAAAPNGRVVGGRIVEVSLVDRPCNPTCKIVMAKADDAGAVAVVEELVEYPENVKTDASAAGPATPEEFTVSAEEIRQIIKSEIADALAAFTPPVTPTEPAAAPVEPAAPAAADAATTPAATPEVQPPAVAADTPVAPVTAPAESSDVVKALAAVTKANEALEARLAKVEAMPTGGGPVVSAPSNAVLPTADSQRTALIAKADAADQTGHSALAQGYRDRAAALLTKS